VFYTARAKNFKVVRFVKYEVRPEDSSEPPEKAITFADKKIVVD